MNMSKVTAIVLAAGRGTRLNAKKKNKVAYRINGKSMIGYTVDHLLESGIKDIIAIVGYQSESVKKELGSSVRYVTQTELLGTGHAVMSAIPELRADCELVLSVYGDDSAFYPPSLYQQMVERAQSEDLDVLLLTITKDNPFGLGRIVRSESGNILRIVEEKNATDSEKAITEINTGFYCFRADFLRDAIGEIKQNPISGEYYLTDLIEIALSSGKKVAAHHVRDASIWHGVNTREDIISARRKIRK